MSEQAKDLSQLSDDDLDVVFSVEVAGIFRAQRHDGSEIEIPRYATSLDALAPYFSKYPFIQTESVHEEGFAVSHDCTIYVDQEMLEYKQSIGRATLSRAVCEALILAARAAKEAKP